MHLLMLQGVFRILNPFTQFLGVIAANVIYRLRFRICCAILRKI